MAWLGGGRPANLGKSNCNASKFVTLAFPARQASYRCMVTSALLGQRL